MFNSRHSRIAMLAVPVCILWALSCSMVRAQVDRQAYLEKEPVAEVDVQSLASSKKIDYAEPNVLTMYQREEEDPLSFYVRTQDGEWLIPAQVNPKDSWVRVLILGPDRPTLVDMAIEINNRSFRAAREQWIDKLLAEAHATFLIRAGVEAAEANEHEGAADTDVVAAGKLTIETSAKVVAIVESEEKSTEEAVEDVVENTSENPDEQVEPEIPMVAAQGRKTSTLFKRLINYLAADQSIEEREASREELRWLLAEWTGGPALLTLSPALAWRRSDAAPLWHALDRDGDSRLSSSEIQHVMATFKLADINQDDIVDLSELERLGKGHAPNERTKGHPLVVVIDENTDWKSLKKNLGIAYQKQEERATTKSLIERIACGDQSFGTADLMELLTIAPDIVCRVSFEPGNEAVAAKLALLTIQGDGDSAWRFHSATAEVITVEAAKTSMEITAAQGDVDAENASGDMQQTQVAFGAVLDGYPLFRLLDHDNNRQLTLRERREVEGILTDLDLNHDGQITPDEIPVAIRLAVTHGPKVHEHLASAVAAQQRDAGDQQDAEVSAWFAGMDRNHDGDLSKREFQGSPAQFAKFDRDGDNLISRVEAQDFEANK